MNRFEILEKDIDSLKLSEREIRIIKTWSLAAYSCGYKDAEDDNCVKSEVGGIK